MSSRKNNASHKTVPLSKSKSIPPPPAPKPSLPGPASSEGGLMSSMVQGLGWGVGTSVGRHMTDSFFNNNYTNKVHPVDTETSFKKQDSCFDDLVKYHQCVIQMPHADNLLNNTPFDCENVFDRYMKCTQKKTVIYPSFQKS